MKWMSKISLRMRITLLTGAMIALVSLLLGYASIYNAGTGFYSISSEWDKSNEEYAVRMSKLTLAPVVAATDGAVAEVDVVNTLADNVTYMDEVDPKDTIFVGMKKMDTGEMVSAQAIAATTITPSKMTMRIAKRFNYWSYVYTALIAGVGTLLSWVVAGRALEPVHKLSQAAVHIGENGLTGRIPVQESKDEVGELTVAFNGMLDRLEASFERQKQFSSNVAHELKTPLATLKMSLQIGQMEQDISTMGIAEHNVDRLIHIVDQLMLLTNEGAVAMEDSIDLKNLLREITREIEPLYQDKSLKVQYVFEERDSFVKGELNLVRRLFFNLIENSMKYSQTSGVIQIAIQEGEKELWVSVSDNGPGIDKEKQQHIFEPFYCADPSRSRQMGGAGLGLSIVRAAAECHGWDVVVDSLAGEGTIFTVNIPVEQQVYL